VHGRISRTTTFIADAALFDMVSQSQRIHPNTDPHYSGTEHKQIPLRPSAAWSRVAREIGADRAFVIAATHGKRAKPHILPHEMVNAMDGFERSILFYADAYAQRRLRPQL
jgi:hypothetical protein